MCYNLNFLYILVVICQPTLGFLNSCQASKNDILSYDECMELYFEGSEKTNFGQVRIDLEEDFLRVTPSASAWTMSFLRISMQDNDTQFCSKLSNGENFYCLTFESEAENQTFLLEYKIEKLPDISSRRFIFTLPNWRYMPLFLYVDQSDTSRLILHAQKLPNFNASYYKVEAYKEKSGNTILQDTRIFYGDEEINYEFFTYNDVGNYYFIIWTMSDNCSNNMCFSMRTPPVFIGRKGTRVVIGIVGASFILPFILFVFHILTKKYPEENGSKPEEHLVVAYKSSTKKHNDVVLALAAMLEKTTKNVIVDVIDLSKNMKKLPQKFCNDFLIKANRIVYVAPPKHDPNPLLVDKLLSQKEFFAVIFDYTADKLPEFFQNKIFKLFDDFDDFTRTLNIPGHDSNLYCDLVKKTEDAKLETEHFINVANVPKIIVTESEPQEHDSLMTAKVVL